MFLWLVFFFIIFLTGYFIYLFLLKQNWKNIPTMEHLNFCQKNVLNIEQLHNMHCFSVCNFSRSDFGEEKKEEKQTWELVINSDRSRVAATPIEK